MTHLTVLFVHILSAVLLMGGTAGVHLAERAVHDAGDLASLRGALDVMRRISRANPALAIVLLASGVYLGRAGFWLEPWFWVSAATWVANLILAVSLVGPAAERLGAAAAKAGDGAVPAAIDALRRASAPAIAHGAMVGIDLGTLANMVLKPDLAEALLWPLLGVGAVLLAQRLGAARALPPPVPGRAA